MAAVCSMLDISAVKTGNQNNNHQKSLSQNRKGFFDADIGLRRFVYKFTSAGRYLAIRSS
jgi:hypothetical protein